MMNLLPRFEKDKSSYLFEDGKFQIATGEGNKNTKKSKAIL
jgi:hypothetical protein